jgi:Family of unknown function (DUF5994)
MSMGRSGDLAAELPDLLALLSVRLGRIDRVLYKLNEWAKACAKLATGGRAVRLDGYRRQPINTVEVLGLNRDKIVLLVVPPNTDPDEAHATPMSAAAPSNDSTVDSLMISARPWRTACRRLAHKRSWVELASPLWPLAIDTIIEATGTFSPSCARLAVKVAAWWTIPVSSYCMCLLKSVPLEQNRIIGDAQVDGLGRIQRANRDLRLPDRMTDAYTS